MHIAEVTAYHVTVPLLSTIRHASYSRTSNDTLIVRSRLDNGVAGWGEGVPREYVTGESIRTAFEQLRSTNLKRQLARSWDTLPDAIELCRSLTFAGAPRDARDCFGNAVRCAVELSVLDAASRNANVPLSAVTQFVPETIALRQSQEHVQYSAAITSMSPSQQWLRAWGIRLYGFRHCKVKVGVAGVDDAALLKRIRRGVGPRMDLRVDANEAWHCRDLISHLEPLLPTGITCVEQPVPHAEVDGLRDIRPQIPVPIMLDESLCSLRDAHRAIELGTCDLFNVRLSKCGGFVNSLLLAAVAHQAGLGYQLGCQIGETGILSAAGRHFATSMGMIRFLEGSYERFLVRERLTVQDLTFGHDGLAPALTGPGLGVDIDEQALRRMTVHEEHWKLC